MAHGSGCWTPAGRPRRSRSWTSPPGRPLPCPRRSWRDSAPSSPARPWTGSPRTPCRAVPSSVARTPRPSRSCTATTGSPGPPPRRWRGRRTPRTCRPCTPRRRRRCSRTPSCASRPRGSRPSARSPSGPTCSWSTPPPRSPTCASCWTCPAPAPGCCPPGPTSRRSRRRAPRSGRAPRRTTGPCASCSPAACSGTRARTCSWPPSACCASGPVARAPTRGCACT